MQLAYKSFSLHIFSFKSPHTIIGKSQYRVFAHSLLAFLTNTIYEIRWINKLYVVVETGYMGYQFMMLLRY